MKVTVVGSHLCPDTLYTLNKLVEAGADIEFKNLSASLPDLKVYLNLRDQDPLYEKVKTGGGIGDPLLSVRRRDKNTGFKGCAEVENHHAGKRKSSNFRLPAKTKFQIRLPDKINTGSPLNPPNTDGYYPIPFCSIIQTPAWFCLRKPSYKSHFPFLSIPRTDLQ